MRVSGFAAGIAIAAMSSAALAPAAHSVEPYVSGAWITVAHTNPGGRAVGGCITVFDDQWNFVDEQCESSNGTLGFPSLDPGEYYAHFSGFKKSNGGMLASLWWGGAEAAESAYTFTVPATGAANMALTLNDAGSIRGWTELTNGTLPDAGTVEIYDKWMRFVTSVPLATSWRVDELRKGDYFVRFVDMPGVANQWYDVPGARVTGNRSLVHVDPAYTGEDATAFTLDGGVTSVQGQLATPSEWLAPQLCIAAYYAEESASVPASFDCGPHGEEFELTSLVDDKSYVFRVLGNVVDTPGAWKTYAGPSWWIGGASKASAARVKLGSEVAYRLPVHHFNDVSAKTQGFWEISWMGDAGISTGYDDSTYRPSGKVIRRDMARFLYRLAGSPEVDVAVVSPFKDVKTTDAAYKAISWLKREGITTVNPFEPKDNVTRRQMALFLYRQAGSPSVTLPSRSPFKDVKKTDSAYKAMVWMKKEGISTGYADGTYKPNADVLRGHMGMFLYRFSTGGH